MSVNVYSTAHLVAKQAMDEVDLISRLAWFWGDPEIKVADSCIQLLFKCQILWIKTLCIKLYLATDYKAWCIYNALKWTEQSMSFGWACTCRSSELVTWVMDHFTMTFLAKTLNMVARYFTYGFWSGPTGACTSTQKVKESWDPEREMMMDEQIKTSFGGNVHTIREGQ